MSEPIQPIVPEGTPLPPAPVGVPPFPITPFAVWTWSSPVIPEFYWNVYSSEQRIKQICKEIGRIEAYLNYLVNKTNENIIELHKRIDVLTERVAALEKHVEEEVARLDALIAQLRSDLEQEIADREQGDANLDKRITQEIHDRQDADEVLHGEISQEVQDRTHADDELHDEISTETQDRIHADDELHEEISKRLLPTDVQAGDEISITRPDPNSNTIIIASTVAHSIADLASTVSGLQAALTSETEERRADDQNLWTAVNERIERGKILAGAGIKVENDPDSSTVTISATGGGTGGATEITGTAPITVTDGEEGEKIVGVSAATEDSAGVITEARVRELAAGEGTAYTAGDGIRISDNKISINNNGMLTISPVPGREEYLRYKPLVKEGPSKGLQRDVTLGPIEGEAESTKKYGGVALNPTPPSWSSNEAAYLGIGVAAGTGLQVASSGELEAKPATESEAGIISEDRVLEIAGTVPPNLSAESPLKLEAGPVISLTKDPAGPVTSSSAGLSVREITPETESEEETGVVSKATIKSLATYSGGVNEAYGLDDSNVGGLRVKASPDVFGFNSSGELALSSRHVRSDEKDWNLPARYQLDRSGHPVFVTDLAMSGTMNPLKKFWLVNAEFQVKEDSASEWKDATIGTFEAFVEASPTVGHLYFRCTPYGASYYAGSESSNVDSWSITAVKITYSVLGLPIEA